MREKIVRVIDEDRMYGYDKMLAVIDCLESDVVRLKDNPMSHESFNIWLKSFAESSYAPERDEKIRLYSQFADNGFIYEMESDDPYASTRQRHTKRVKDVKRFAEELSAESMSITCEVLSHIKKHCEQGDYEQVNEILTKNKENK